MFAGFISRWSQVGRQEGSPAVNKPLLAILALIVCSISQRKGDPNGPS